MRMQNADEGQIAVTLGIVQSVADDEIIGNAESHVIRRDRLHPARGLVQQDANLDPARPQLAQFGRYAKEGPASVQNIIDEQDVPPADVQAQFLGKDHVGRFGAVAVTGDPDKIQPQRQGQPAQQISQENDSAIEEGHDDQIAAGKIVFHLTGQDVDAPGQALGGDQNGSNLLAPKQRGCGEAPGLGNGNSHKQDNEGESLRFKVQN